MKQSKTSFRQAFTLIEVLVAIGVILVLVAILIPAVTYIRQSGYATATSAQIHALESAINSYYATFRAYPGPVPDEAVGKPNAASGITGNITGTENLFLALCGGLNANGAYDPTLVGSGPFRTDPVTGTAKHLKPFYDNWATEISNSRDPGYSKDYRFREAPAPGGAQADDSNIPEFMDRFPDSMPLLYLRARVGAPGVADGSSMPTYQYSTYQVNGYTNAPSRGRKLGLTGSVGTPPQHGLGVVQNAPEDYTKGNIRTYTLNAYLSQDPNNPNLNPAQGVCRVRDTYIIISAGSDRIYGTADDITSSGSIVR